MNGTVLLRALDRAVLLDTLGERLSAQLERLPAYGATELLLFCLGRDAYADRWAEQTVPFELGDDLDPEERTRRQRVVEEMLGLTDIRLILRQLARDRNVWLILDNKLAWGSF